MKNSRLRSFVLVLLVSGMAFGVFFPVVPVRRATALENPLAVSETQKPDAADVDQQLANIPVYFEENRGQHNERVKYVTRSGGTEMFLTATEAVYVVRSQESIKSQGSGAASRDQEIDDLLDGTLDSKAVAVYMRLAGSKTDANFPPAEPLKHRTNYFKGNESAWRTEIPNYGRVMAENIYDGVDIVWYGRDQGSVQYDFVVGPNADPNQIEWEIEGAENVSLETDGSLVIETEAGVIRQSKPFTYQETEGIRSEVASSFILSEADRTGAEKLQRVKFALGGYDRSKPLTIDPTMDLAYSTFLGGSNTDAGTAIKTDLAGNTYVVGYTLSTEFPTTAGTFDTTQNGTYDVFVTKLNADGSGLLYSTFIGGTSDDLGYSIAVDASGNAFVTGFTFVGAPNYPTTAGAFDTTHNGNWDVFVTKLNATGSSLLYSTLIGGSGQDEGFGIAVDSSGSAIVTGFTLDGDPDYPTTGGAFDTTQNGDYDVFVTKLNATGSLLVYSTFIGGNATDAGFCVEVDPTGNAFVTGYAVSPNYPTTAGSFDTTHNGSNDAFVVKLNPAGSSLVYSTFLGGSAADAGFHLVPDQTGNVFVTGFTVDDVTDFPTTAGAFDTTANGFVDVFVTKINAAGSGLLFSTFIGGSNDDFGEGIAVDSSGNAFVTGYSNSPDYPVTAAAFDTSHNGGNDVIVTKLNASGSSLMYSTFIGGGLTDSGFAVAVDAPGNALVTGRASGGTSVFPTTSGVIDPTHNGGFDVFVAKLGVGSSPFDFDGDGKTDLGIFRLAPGEWWINRSTNGTTFATQFGAATDRLVPVDFTGDGKMDVAFWRPGTGQWFVLRSEDFSFYAFPFGASGDVPVPADYDGDGKADAAVFRESAVTWYINKSSGGTDILTFGAVGDKPVNADYDGDGKSDIAIFRPNGAEWWIRRSSNASVVALQFGASADKAVAGDYTGDGKADVAFWRPSTGFWNVLRSEDFSYYAFPFGTTGDVASPGDYDGDGKLDAAVFRPSSSTWFANRSTAGVLIQQFGTTGDLPLPNAFVR